MYLQGEADYLHAVYSDRTESNRILKPTTTPIFCPQRIQEQFLEIHEISQNNTSKGLGSVFERLHVKVACAIPSFNGLFTHTILIKRVINYCHLYCESWSSGKGNVRQILGTVDFR